MLTNNKVPKTCELDIDKRYISTLPSWIKIDCAKSLVTVNKPINTYLRRISFKVEIKYSDGEDVASLFYLKFQNY